VAAALALDAETGLQEGRDALASRDLGEPAHTATSSTPKLSSGTGRPSSASAST
jgi:hypothetical protein